VTRRVLVTRPAGTWPKLSARFQGSSIQIEMSETTVQVEPIDPGPGDEAIGQLRGYDWLVVTSGRGVAALLRRLAARGAAGLPPELRVAAVGPATAGALAAVGARVDLLAAEATSDGLEASLGPQLSAGTRVILVRPEGTSSGLASALRTTGAVVDEAPLYRTVASPRSEALAAGAISGSFAAVVFTAPSSLDLWLDAAGLRRAALVAALQRIARVAIGPTTATHLQSIGLPADAVADAPSEDAVGDAIARALGIDLLR
jgi:uroporphyrinogen-III synthase